MQSQKISISLPQEQFVFMENYQLKHNYKTRSEVIKKALYLLRQAELEACYKEANQEINDDFETTTQDGIDENETW